MWRVFSTDIKMTIGVEFFLKEIKIEDIECTLQLWDFGGQERFRFLLDSYVIGAKGALLMFDLTRMGTLKAIEQWVGILRKYDPELPILFLGTKLDLVEQISVNDEYALEFKEKYNLFDYLKISSKTGENINKALENLLKKNIVKHVKGLYYINHKKNFIRKWKELIKLLEDSINSIYGIWREHIDDLKKLAIIYLLTYVNIGEEN